MRIASGQSPCRSPLLPSSGGNESLSSGSSIALTHTNIVYPARKKPKQRKDIKPAVTAEHESYSLEFYTFENDVCLDLGLPEAVEPIAPIAADMGVDQDTPGELEAVPNPRTSEDIFPGANEGETLDYAADWTGLSANSLSTLDEGGNPNSDSDLFDELLL